MISLHVAASHMAEQGDTASIILSLLYSPSICSAMYVQWSSNPPGDNTTTDNDPCSACRPGGCRWAATAAHPTPPSSSSSSSSSSSAPFHYYYSSSPQTTTTATVESSLPPPTARSAGQGAAAAAEEGGGGGEGRDRRFSFYSSVLYLRDAFHTTRSSSCTPQSLITGTRS
jgi:hypothetical protein